MTIRFQVNGSARVVDTDPNRRLLDVLREDLGLTGTKFGCGEGQCRACTVLVNGKPMTSCLVPASQAAGAEIVTIEGLANGDRLHPVQEAFLAESAMQCGYCVPGMILQTVGLLNAHPKPTDEQILDWMEGSICRCCGYKRIVAAVQRAAESAAQSRAGE